MESAPVDDPVAAGPIDERALRDLAALGGQDLSPRSFRNS